jgi:hypothetical protein
MKTAEACKYFKLNVAGLRKIVRELGIERVGVGNIQIYSNMDIAKIKAGLFYKDYIWTQDIDRFWIWYGFSPNGEKEIKIEI